MQLTVGDSLDRSYSQDQDLHAVFKDRSPARLRPGRSIKPQKIACGLVTLSTAKAHPIESPARCPEVFVLEIIDFFSRSDSRLTCHIVPKRRLTATEFPQKLREGYISRRTSPRPTSPAPIACC